MKHREGNIIGEEQMDTVNITCENPICNPFEVVKTKGLPSPPAGPLDHDSDNDLDESEDCETYKNTLIQGLIKVTTP